jgi:1,4-dihydroxy-2-naphthoyl-CoA hydrolase
MAIWHEPLSVAALNEHLRSGLVSQLGIEFTAIGDDWISATMPVDHRTLQPAGILHGGASVALAESIGSTAANLVVDRTQKLCVGLEVNANHVRAVRSGRVTGTAQPLHLGTTTQVWDIRVIDDQGRLVCVSRLTMAVLDL